MHFLCMSVMALSMVGGVYAQEEEPAVTVGDNESNVEVATTDVPRDASDVSEEAAN